MAIRAKCPNRSCGTLMSVKDEDAGKKAQCPVCGTPVVVPSRTAPGSLFSLGCLGDGAIAVGFLLALGFVVYLCLGTGSARDQDDGAVPPQSASRRPAQPVATGRPGVRHEEVGRVAGTGYISFFVYAPMKDRASLRWIADRYKVKHADLWGFQILFFDDRRHAARDFPMSDEALACKFAQYCRNKNMGLDKLEYVRGRGPGTD